MEKSSIARALPLVLFLAPALLLAPGPAPAGEEVKKVALDFDDVDIRLFIRVISEFTGKNFIVDNNVRGKVTVISPRKLTTGQAFEVFESVLAVNGFALVDAGEAVKVVPARNMSGYEVPVHTRRTSGDEDRFITQIMPLEHLDARAAQGIVKPLLSRQATVTVTPSSDLLIVTDYKSTIRKVRRILDEIDVDPADIVVEKLDLRYSSPTEAASKMTEILEAKYGKERRGIRERFFKLVPLERIDAVVSVAAPEASTDIRTLLAAIDQPSPGGKNLLNVYYLEHADAEEMMKILTRTLQSGPGPPAETRAAGTGKARTTEAGGTVLGGRFAAPGREITITADKSTNSLVVYSRPDDYAAMEEMIRKLDIPRRQVFLEALIMEVSPNEDFRFGSEWQSLKSVGHPYTNHAAAGVIGGSRHGGELDSLFARGGEGGWINLGSGFSLGMIGESIDIGGYRFPSLGVLIRAVESLDSVNVLSKPQLLTLNNETARINISENRPFQTTETRLEGGGTSQNIDYRDVGIILEITPHINKQGKIRLELNQEVNRITGSVTETQPITRKRTINTVVEVMNGHTVVIGGLIEREQDFSKSRVPCLGGLPFAGWGFKSMGMTDRRTNLLVFLSPRVIDSATEADDLSNEKRRHMEKERSGYDRTLRNEKPWFHKLEQKDPAGGSP